MSRDDSTPDDSTPDDSTSAERAPDDSTAPDRAPADSATPDRTPADSAPGDAGGVLDDDEWDRAADAELDALAASMPLPGPRPPWERPVVFPPPPRVYDRQLAVLTADGVGEFLRACRANAGLSQRQVAEAAGVPQSTISRIEAGHAPGVTLATVARLAEECDVILVGTTGSHAPMIESDLGQRHRDGAGRWLPAHLFNAPRDPDSPAELLYGRWDRPLPARRYVQTRLRDVPDS